MKVAVIFYHSNILNVCKKEWIDQCVNSIKNQTFKEFDVFELNYGDDDNSFTQGVFARGTYIKRKFDNHIGAMNYLYDMLFSNGYDIVFNTNVDDYYSENRIERQLSELSKGFDMVSSNFVYVNEDNVPFENMDMASKGNVSVNLYNNHNIICHPAVAMNKSFWTLKYNESLVGREDLDMWQRAIRQGKKISIVNECLCMYRRHEKQITAVKKKNVNLLIIATNKYTKYIKPLLESADKFFLPDCNVNYCLFTDDMTMQLDSYKRKVLVWYVEHRAWPYTTLMRYHTFLSNIDSMPDADNYFYVDVDTLFKGVITANDVISDRTVVRHCGFIGKRGPYETNPLSTSFVRPNQGLRYYGGGFWGFSKDEFYKLLYKATSMINVDADKGIIPVWHDESVLNRYMIDNPPKKELSPSYHYPEGKIGYYRNLWHRDYECKILLLDKDHAEVRSEEVVKPFITMKEFGNFGRLGNQLFQYASLIGLSYRNGKELRLPFWKYSHFFQGKYPKGVPVNTCVDVQEPSFGYSLELSGIEKSYEHLGQPGVSYNVIKSYLQSAKYWAGAENIVAHALKFDKEFSIKCLEGMAEAFNKKTIAIHIRRGDYVNNTNYVNLPPMYYIMALEKHFNNWRTEYNLIFFSDDIEYAKIHFECLDNAYFSEGRTDVEDLCLMSMCVNHIIANSSFSWWGAYLSGPTSKVVRPAHHFSGKLAERCKTDDLYPANWIAFDHVEEKYDLSHVTFMIPVFIDHNDRMKNLDLVREMIKVSFDTNIIYCEQGTNRLANRVFIDGERYCRLEGSSFHRTKMINIMCKASDTPIIANWDADVIVAPMQIIEAVRKIEDGADMVSPYDWRFARIPQFKAWHEKIRASHDIGVVSGHRKSFIGFNEGDSVSWGGAVFFNKYSFIEGGMENENFISFGPEDVERRDRFMKLGYLVERVKGPLYHLNHYKGINSSKKHCWFADNRAEYEKVRLMSAEDLKEYIKTWTWTK